MQEDGGPEKWRQYLTWLNTPPAVSASSTPARREHATIAAVRASVGDEAQAFRAMEAALAGEV